MDSLLGDLEQRIAVLETDVVLRRIDFQLKRNVSDSFALAKHEAATALPDYLFALQRLRKMRPIMHSWEKTASLLVSSLRAHANASVAVQSPEFTSLVHASIAVVRATYNVEEARFAKKLFEVSCISSSCGLQDEGIEFACWLVELKNPHTHLPLRALGLDVVALYAQVIEPSKLLHLVNFALQCATVTVNHQIRDLHKGIEDAVRRLCETNSNNVLIGKALVETLWKTRGVVSAYKLSQKLHLSSHFPGLTETARRAQIMDMIAIGPNKAFGWGTIKPDRRLLTMSMLIEHGYHLTAMRMATEAGDLDRIRIEYGCELDLTACERELAERKAKYLQLDPTVNVHMINTWEDLLQAQPVLVSGEGVLTLDVEWVPQISHGAGDCPVQLMQFARGRQHVFLIDISPKSALLLLQAHGFHAFMHDFICKQQEVWGFGLEMDCKMLAQSFPREQWPNLIRPRVRNIPVPNKNTGLKTMCQLVLGKELDKEQQMSLWSRRPLLAEQIAYAALDVHVLVLLHERLHDCLALQPVTAPTPIAHVVGDIDEVVNNTGRYFCDEMLLRTAKMLRAVNVDCLFESSSEVARRRDVIQARIQRAHQDGRIFITADTALRHLPGVYCLIEQDNEQRFRELCKQFHIPLDRNTILLRCTMCNNAEFTVCTREQAREINPTVVTDLVFSDTRITEYYSCASCHSVVWQGPKYKQVQSRMARLMETM